MSKLKPGHVVELFEANLGYRDAFHVPCVLVSSSYVLSSGQPVMFTKNFKHVIPCAWSNRHAIVDPFVTREQISNRAFWVMIIPDVVKDLSHHFNIDVDGVEDSGDVHSYFDKEGYDDRQDECAGC